MAAETEISTQLHGGRLVAKRLREYGITKLFTLSGGHLFSIYDGCRAEGIEIIDVRHEQSAAFAAEGWAKVTRSIGACALTAGPGVTNGMSAIASASQNHSPLLVLGGRAPQFRWGQGSLQEIDHVPFLRPLVKLAATADSPTEIPELLDEAVRAALTPHSGPVFVDFPLEHVFSPADEPTSSYAGRTRSVRAERVRRSSPSGSTSIGGSPVIVISSAPFQRTSRSAARRCDGSLPDGLQTGGEKARADDPDEHPAERHAVRHGGRVLEARIDERASRRSPATARRRNGRGRDGARRRVDGRARVR